MFAPTAYMLGYFAGTMGDASTPDPTCTTRLDKIAWTHGYHVGSGGKLLKGANA